MSYATEAPDATVAIYPMWQRDRNHVIRQRRKNRYPVPTTQGFDFYMNLCEVLL